MSSLPCTDDESFFDFMRRFENLKEVVLWLDGGDCGGVIGGDNGDFGLPCADVSGDEGREHVFDAVTGLDGGFSGSGREAAVPAERALDAVAWFGRSPSGSGWLLSIFDSPGGVGGRSPESSYENEVFAWIIMRGVDSVDILRGILWTIS